MWIYEKKLQYPIRIKNPDPRMAQVILTQYGGPDGKCLSGGKQQLFILMKKAKLAGFLIKNRTPKSRIFLRTAVLASTAFGCPEMHACQRLRP